MTRIGSLEGRTGRRRSALLVVPLVLAGTTLVSCGDDEADPASTSAASTSPATTQPATTEPATTEPATTPPATTQPATTQPTTTTQPATTTAPTTTVPVVPSQPAVWPAADVVLTTPEAAAAGFVETVLRVPPVLGEFMSGDQRSGEIEVLSPGEGGPGSTVPRSLLLLRQLGPDDGWFVLAAIRPEVSIDTPEAYAVVPAAPLEVSGVARGFEATIIVTAFVAGTGDRLVEPVIAMGGALETPEPYTATLDLTGVPVGTVVTILVRGDTGLETDPGEFSAIPVVIGE